MDLSKLTKEQLYSLKDNIENELEIRKEKEEVETFKRNKIVSPNECPDTKTRLLHNREAIRHDSIARHAMIKVRKERLSEIEKQDMNCLRKIRNMR